MERLFNEAANVIDNAIFYLVDILMVVSSMLSHRIFQIFKSSIINETF